MLSGALVLHSFSAVIAFVGAFVLVRYKVKEAKKEEANEEGKDPKGPVPDSDPNSHSENLKKNGANQIWSTSPHLEQTGYFRQSRPPSYILYQTHSIAIITAFTGFVFSIVGMVCYAWSQQARSVSIFTSACVGGCVLVSVVVVKPFAKAERKN